MTIRKVRRFQRLSRLERSEDAMDFQQGWGTTFNERTSSHEERRRREEELERTKQRQIMELPPLPRRAAPHPGGICAKLT